VELYYILCKSHRKADSFMLQFQQNIILMKADCVNLSSIDSSKECVFTDVRTRHCSNRAVNLPSYLLFSAVNNAIVTAKPDDRMTYIICWHNIHLLNYFILSTLVKLLWENRKLMQGPYQWKVFTDFQWNKLNHLW
jgi:hypothetical protein